MFPARSDFETGEPWAVWWTTNGQQVCSTQGRSFVRQVQRRLRALLPVTYGVGGTQYTRDDIAVDGNPGEKTLAGLHYLAASWQAPGAMVASVGAELSARNRGASLSQDTHELMAWVLMGDPRAFKLSELKLEPPSRTLRFGTAPASDASNADRLACYPIGQQPPTAGGSGGNTPPVVSGTQPLPGSSPVPGAGTSSWTTGEKWAAGIVVVGVVAIVAIAASSAKSRPRIYRSQPRALPGPTVRANRVTLQLGSGRRAA